MTIFRTLITSLTPRRWLTHGVMLGLTVLALFLTQALYLPRGDLIYVSTIGFGYWSLFLIAVTLSIGPLYLVFTHRKRNPVNLDIRRDVGVWAAITGLLHVFFGLQVHNRIGILGYFFVPGTLTPRLDRVGFNNDVGLAATIVIALLLATSNTWSLRKLKGKRWKTLQRLNYPLAVLVILHTLGYQAASRRETVFINATLILTMGLLMVQFVGVWLTKLRADTYTLRQLPVKGQ